MDANTEARVQEAQEKIFDPLKAAYEEGDLNLPDGVLRTLRRLAEVYGQIKRHLHLLHKTAQMDLDIIFNHLQEGIEWSEDEPDTALLYYLFEVDESIDMVKRISRTWFLFEYQGASLGKVCDQWEKRSDQWKEKYELEVKRTEEARAIALKMFELAPSLKQECHHLMQPELYPPGFYEAEADDQSQSWLFPNQINPN